MALFRTGVSNIYCSFVYTFVGPIRGFHESRLLHGMKYSPSACTHLNMSCTIPLKYRNIYSVVHLELGATIDILQHNDNKMGAVV